MQLKYLQSITQPSDGIVKVTAICWAPNGKKLAVCTTDRVVLMFDENGVRKDKFATKPADKVHKIYLIIILIYLIF
jgi:intraflagellar transport protein 172